MDSASALAALNSFQPTSSEDLMSQAQTKYNIPQLSERVKALTGITNNLTNSISAVDPSVTGRTSGTFTTEAQRSALVNREKQPLLNDLSGNNQSLDFAKGDLNTNQSFADKLAASLVSDQNDKYTRLKNQYDISKAAEDERARQALEQQKLAETVRANQASESISAAKGSSSKGGSGTLSKQDVTAAIRQGLDSVKGRDNHVAPQDLAQAYRDWMQSGLSDKDFWSNFQGYWNPKQGNYKQQFNAAR